MISLRSALVSERNCPPEHLDVLDDDWMEPAYLSFTLLLTMFSSKQDICFSRNTERHKHAQIHKYTHFRQSKQQNYSFVKAVTTQLATKQRPFTQRSVVKTAPVSSVFSRWSYSSANALIRQNTHTHFVHIHASHTNT